MAEASVDHDGPSYVDIGGEGTCRWVGRSLSRDLIAEAELATILEESSSSSN